MSIREKFGLKKKNNKKMNSHKSPHTFDTVYSQYRGKPKNKVKEDKIK